MKIMNKYQNKMEGLIPWQVVETSKEVTVEDILSLEKEIGYSLGTDYANFILHYGGFSFEDYVCFILEQDPRDGEKGFLEVFYDILPGDRYDLIEKYNCYKNRIPRNLLPIADSSGDIVCISLAGDNKDCVYLWDHEDEEMVEDPGYSNVYLLAHSFDEFMNSLEIDSEEDEDE